MHHTIRYKDGVLVEIDGVAPEKKVIFPQDWPILLRPMKLLAQEGDKGLGDIVERVIGPVGGTAYKTWYISVFGKPCGCTKRKDNLNEQFPLNPIPNHHAIRKRKEVHHG